jgi:hypothetical protein
MFGSKQIKDFLLERSSNPDVFSYCQSLEDILTSLNPSTVRDKRQIEIALSHVREIRRKVKKLTTDASET